MVENCDVSAEATRSRADASKEPVGDPCQSRKPPYAVGFRANNLAMPDDRERAHKAHGAGRAGRRALWRYRGGASRLAEPPGARHGALSAGGRRRHHGAYHLCQARRESRPAIRHRESRRRRRHHWRGRGGESRSRRLRDLARCHGVLGQCLALPGFAVRLPQGFRPGIPGVAGAEHPGRHPVGAGEHGRRRHRFGQSLARRHRHGVVRQRHAAASLPRNVQACYRHHDQSRAVSRRRAGAHRRDVRPGEILFCQRFGRGRADQIRQAQGDRPYRCRPAGKLAGDSAGLRHACRLRGL